MSKLLRGVLIGLLFVVACGGAPSGVVEWCDLETARRIGQVCESDPYVRPDGTTGYRVTVFHCEPLKRWTTCPTPVVGAEYAR